MNNSKFWGAAGGSIQSVPVKTSGPKNKKIVKKIGVVGVVLLILLGIVGALFYNFIARPAFDLMNTVTVLKEDGKSIQSAAKDRDLVALDKALNKFGSDLDKTRAQRDKDFGWAKNLTWFKINEFYSDTDRFITAGFYAIDAIREVETVVKPFADAAGLKVSEDQQVDQTQGLMKAFSSWISLMPKVADQMDGVIAKVDKIGTELAQVNTEKYPEEFRGMKIRYNVEFAKNTLSKASDYGPDIKRALTVFPRVLAVGTPVKRYMIIMQNNKEIRATGGFMTNYATFKIQDALLQSDFSSKDMYSVDLTLDTIDATYTFPTAPPAYQRYLKNTRWYARDMNYSPDFPTSMDQFMKFYKLAGTINPVEIKQVDGVVAIDTNVIQELLSVTGPVTVNGLTYTADNVVLELEKMASLELREQANRKKILGDLMEAMLINVFNSDKDLWPKLINTGVELASQKHILVYLFDTDAQALVEKYNFAGRIQDPVQGDYSYINSSNLGGDKTNWFVNKEITETLQKDGTKWNKTVQIKYTYNEPSAEFSPFVKRFKDWVRVYAPLGSEFIGVEGSEDGTTTDQERNKVWYSGYVEMGPGESKTLTFTYTLPASAVGDKQYNLLIQKQSGIDKEKYTVIVGNNKQTFLLDTDKSISIDL